MAWHRVNIPILKEHWDKSKEKLHPVENQMPQSKHTALCLVSGAGVASFRLHRSFPPLQFAQPLSWFCPFHAILSCQVPAAFQDLGASFHATLTLAFCMPMKLTPHA